MRGRRQCNEPSIQAFIQPKFRQDAPVEQTQHANRPGDKNPLSMRQICLRLAPQLISVRNRRSAPPLLFPSEHGAYRLYELSLKTECYVYFCPKLNNPAYSAGLILYRTGIQPSRYRQVIPGKKHALYTTDRNNFAFPVF